MNEHRLVLQSFLKGVISSVADNCIPNDAFCCCRNVDFVEKKVPMSIKGHKVYATLAKNEHAQNQHIQGGIVYNNSDVGEIVVVACGGNIWYSLLNDNTHTFKKYQINKTDLCIDALAPVEMVQYNNKIYFVNGKYPIISNDLSQHSVIGILNKYDASFIDDTNAHRARLKGLKYIHIHNERLFGANSLEQPNGIYWSEAYTPENWTPPFGQNYDVVGKDDGENITGIATLNENYVYVFKMHNVYRYMTVGTNDMWATNRVDTTHGAIAHRTIKLFEGNLLYLSPNAVAALNGNNVTLIDENIQNLTTKIMQCDKYLVQRKYSKIDDFGNSQSTKNGIVIKNGTITALNDISFGQDCAQNKFDDEGYFKEGFGGTYPNSITSTRGGLVLQTNQTARSNLSNGQKPCPYVTHRSHLTLFLQQQNVSYPISQIKIKVKSTEFDQNSKGIISAIVQDRQNNVVLGTKKLGDLKAGDYVMFDNGKTSIAQEIVFMVDTFNTNEKDKTIVFEQAKDGGSALFDESYVFFSRGNELKKISVGMPICQLFLANETFNDSYCSKEIDTLCEGTYNISHVNVRLPVVKETPETGSKKIPNVKLNTPQSFTLHVASYDTSKPSWADISLTDIETFYSSNAKPDETESLLSGNVLFPANKITGKRYLRFFVCTGSSKDVYTGNFCINNVTFKINGDSLYSCEPIRIGNNNVKQWDTFEADVGSTDTVNPDNVENQNCPTFYMRSADNATEILASQWKQVYINQVVTDMDLKDYVQFRADFASNALYTVKSFTINYKTSEMYQKPHAITYKTKYILNMSDATNADNNIEYIYDRAGYWTIKDNEHNSVYFKTTNFLFAGSNETQTIRLKDSDDYKNDGKPYESYFITKKFRLTEFENLFRYIKVQYKSNSKIVVSYCVDEGEFVPFECKPYGKLYEIRQSLAGIVKGQTIQIKVFWQSNAVTEIHKIALLARPVRELR